MHRNARGNGAACPGVVKNVASPLQFVGPCKRSAAGRYCIDAALPGGNAFARPMVGTVRFVGPARRAPPGMAV
ncbi:hypothetical protein [Pseudescherichia sp.]|uniref:hypothetical protein n=1 Tax=Pseudescherichia sp. TaxID=2055881 RepID=UPI00289A4CE0|nr:hypothetical protein [Pseudescherichia sp.]